MTDRLHSCKESPDGKHHVVPGEYGCHFCHRGVNYLTDYGWNAPAIDPDHEPQETTRGALDEA